MGRFAGRLRPLLILASLAGVFSTTAFAADMPAARPTWSCACRTYDGSADHCYMYAEISGRTFSFGAFETSGEGVWRLTRRRGEQIVTGDIRTSTGGSLRAIIVTQGRARISNVFIGERSGAPTFTAICKGRL